MTGGDEYTQRLDVGYFEKGLRKSHQIFFGIDSCFINFGEAQREVKAENLPKLMLLIMKTEGFEILRYPLKDLLSLNWYKEFESTEEI